MKQNGWVYLNFSLGVSIGNIIEGSDYSSRRLALERNHWDKVTIWTLWLENYVFYLPDILSPKIHDNPEMSIVRFRIIRNIIVRIKIRIRVSILTLILTEILAVDVLPVVAF